MENLLWGLQTTLLGMGLVFSLLALMWGLLTVALRLDQPSEPAPRAGGPEPAPAAPEPQFPPGLDEQTMAAILVATLAHRAQRRREAAPAMRSYWPGSLLYASRWVGAGRAVQNHGWRRGYR
ncbi:MAG: OadG family protein [Vicinamibacteria bacterium]|nr:OadG family protein [Vicinamibacteria bacterium]